MINESILGDDNLYFYRARYYNPNIGRFISEDPVAIDDDLSPYVYVGNRPSIRIDPTGLVASTAMFKPPRSGCKNTKAQTSKLSTPELPCDGVDPWIFNVNLLCPDKWKRVFWDQYYGDVPNPSKFPEPKGYTRWRDDFIKACSSFKGGGKSYFSDGWHGGGQGGICCVCTQQ